MAATRKRTPRDKRVEQQQADAEEEFAILFPFQTVELSTGEKIDVRQWDIDTGARLTGRIVSLMQKVQESRMTGEIEPDQLLMIAKDECVDIVCGTIGWSREKLFARVPFEDLLALLDVVANQNLVREDGGGVLPKIVGLAGVLGPLGGLTGSASASPPPSTSSSGPDTPSPTSD